MTRRCHAAGRLEPRRSGAVRLVDVELAGPLPDIRPLDPAQTALRALVRLHGHPLGTVSMPLPPDGVGGGAVAEAIWASLAGPVCRHLEHDGQAPPTSLSALGLAVDGHGVPCSWQAMVSGPAPSATIVITTCAWSRRLAGTIRDALAQTYPDYEVVVVDNRPATSGVRRALEARFPAEERLRYAAEDRVGLSWARNRGAGVARGQIVAFTDDDVEIDPDWLGWLVSGFRDPAVACVTGLIVPLELETPSQRLLEEFGGYSKGFEHRLWDGGAHRLDHPLYPYTAGAFGSGANAAFRREALADLGGFDGSLGAGTPARGGEDLDIYVSCVQRGYAIAYEPAAIVRHAHLREMAEVHQKVRDYGVGLGAMVTKHLLQDWPSFAAVLRRVPAGAVHLLSGRSSKNASRSSSYPRSLVLAELEGLVYGPLAYLRSRASS